MPSLRFRQWMRGLVFVMLGLTLTDAAVADVFPSKPITMIVPFPPGGAVDIQARLLSQIASKQLGQPIVIVNRAGASGSLGPQIVRAAAPDGYTLTMFGGNLFRLPYMQKVYFDPLKDFTYVISLVDFGFGITVAANAPWRNLEELLSYAKANPGKVSAGAIGPGAAGHVALLQLQKIAAVQFNYIPYKGAIESQLAAAAGQVDFAADTAFAPLVFAGKLRLLAIMNDTRSAMFMSTPTLKELGYDVAASSSVGIVGPRGLDSSVVKVVHDAYHAALAHPEFKRLLEQQALTLRYLDSKAYGDYSIQQTANERQVVTELLGMPVQ